MISIPHPEAIGGAERADSGSGAMGHRLVTPDGREITVDRDALAELQRARLLTGHRSKIKPGIYPALVRGLLSDRLRRHIGEDLTGPAVCTCACSQCIPRVNT